MLPKLNFKGPYPAVSICTHPPFKAAPCISNENEPASFWSYFLTFITLIYNIVGVINPACSQWLFGMGLTAELCPECFWLPKLEEFWLSAPHHCPGFTNSHQHPPQSVGSAMTLYPGYPQQPQLLQVCGAHLGCGQGASMEQGKELE